MQHHLLADHVQGFDGEVPVQHRDHHAAVLGGQGAVHQDFIAVIDPDAFHGVPGDAEEVGGGDIADQHLVEVDPPVVEAVLGRGGESGRHPDQDRVNQYRIVNGQRHGGGLMPAMVEHLFDS